MSCHTCRSIHDFFKFNMGSGANSIVGRRKVFGQCMRSLNIHQRGILSIVTLIPASTRVECYQNLPVFVGFLDRNCRYISTLSKFLTIPHQELKQPRILCHEFKLSFHNLDHWAEPIKTISVLKNSFA